MKPADVVLALCGAVIGFIVGMGVADHIGRESAKAAFDAAWRCCGGK